MWTSSIKFRRRKVKTCLAKWFWPSIFQQNAHHGKWHSTDNKYDGYEESNKLDLTAAPLFSIGQRLKMIALGGLLLVVPTYMQSQFYLKN
jgi:hypothetical protein